MEMFIVVVILLWMPLILWWLFCPHCFPFFTHKKFGRFSLFGLNLVFYFLLMIIAGLIFSAQEQSVSQEADFVDVVGMFVGFGFVIWVILRGIKIGRLAKSKNLSNKPTSIIRPKIDFERLNRTPKQPSPPKQLNPLINLKNHKSIKKLHPNHPNLL